MTEPPLQGLNYSDDLKIQEWCTENPEDSRCGCINLPEDIKKINTNSISPYFCWYAPCKSLFNFITLQIQESQKICNNLDCNISLGDVSVSDGIINIENNCISNISTDSIVVSDTFYNTASTDIANLFLPYNSLIFVIILSILFIFL